MVRKMREAAMIAVKALYDQGRIEFIEPIPANIDTASIISDRVVSGLLVSDRRRERKNDDTTNHS